MTVRSLSVEIPGITIISRTHENIVVRCREYWNCWVVGNCLFTNFILLPSKCRCYLNLNLLSSLWWANCGSEGAGELDEVCSLDETLWLAMGTEFNTAPLVSSSRHPKNKRLICMICDVWLIVDLIILSLRWKQRYVFGRHVSPYSHVQAALTEPWNITGHCEV